jgi:TusA-related sulfurtransferase
MAMYKIYKRLDLTGSSCAGPIGELSGVMEELKAGEAVEVLLGDEGTKKDVVNWVSKKGYKVLAEEKEGNKIKLVIGR